MHLIGFVFVWLLVHSRGFFASAVIQRIRENHSDSKNVPSGTLMSPHHAHSYIERTLTAPSMVHPVRAPLELFTLDLGLVKPNLPFDPLYPSIAWISGVHVKVRERRIRVLGLSNWRAYREKVARQSYVVFSYMEFHPFIDYAGTWGVNEDDWIPGYTLRQNLVHKYGDLATNFDLIVFDWYHRSDYDLPGVAEVSAVVPTAAILHECRADYFDCEVVAYETKAALLLVHNLDGLNVQRYAKEQGAVVFTTLAGHWAQQALLRRHATEPRRLDVVLAGVVFGLYPFRARLKAMIETGMIPGTVLHNLTSLNDYSMVLSNAKIALIDSSSVRIPLLKYTEAACAGALIIGEVPLQMAEEFRRYIVPIKPEDSTSIIISTVNWWLQHDDARIKAASAAQAWCRSRFHPLYYAEDTLDAYQHYVDGDFGLYSQYPVAIGCRAATTALYDNNGPNEWCPNRVAPWWQPGYWMRAADELLRPSEQIEV